MKSNNILLLSALLLSGLFIGGCASQPDYREATRGGFGYTESKFTDTQYLSLIHISEPTRPY